MRITAVSQSVRDYLQSFATFYPSIDTWCAKVLKEVPSGRRTILALVTAGKLDGLGIVKNGPHAKLCHISVTDHVRGDGCGWALMRAAANEMLRRGTRHIHVTTSEEVADEYGHFFARCGFSRGSYRNGRYRRGATEWEWTASHADLATRLLGSGSRGAQRAAPTVFRFHGDLEWVPVAELPSCVNRQPYAQFTSPGITSSGTVRWRRNP